MGIEELNFEDEKPGSEMDSKDLFNQQIRPQIGHRRPKDVHHSPLLKWEEFNEERAFVCGGHMDRTLSK